ncbi:MAG: hypothetical protein IJM50_01410 [Lachnospiraceae bacterium]|nr:hypothetical protein [Lachnospiraceae bacterium]
MTKKTQDKIKKWIPYISVVVIAALVILGVYLFADRSDTEPTKPQSSTGAETLPGKETDDEPSVIVNTTEAPTESTVPAPPTASPEDAANIDRLISRYYAAKLADDADELNRIVDAETPYDAASLSSETQFISKYDHFETYVIPGVSNSNFIVYVKYDIFFNGIRTGAPALNHFICVKDGESYFIYNKEISGEFRAYLEDTENSETVAKLKKQVDEELAEACNTDEDLKYLMELLNGDSQTESSAASSAEDTTEAVSTTEAASVS